MSLVSQLFNKIQYHVTKAVSDPKANEFVKEQAAQAKQEAEIKERKELEVTEKKKINEMALEKQKEIINLNERNTFSIKRAIGKAASGILNALRIIVFIVLVIYGGILAANDAIGYNFPFRILSFIYGCVCFWYIIPRSFFHKYYAKIDVPYYSMLPISTYKPVGMFESLIYGPFCYTEDSRVLFAKQAVETLYKNGYLRSINQALIAGTVASVSMMPPVPNPSAPVVPKPPSAPEVPKPTETPKAINPKSEVPARIGTSV